jgi:DNA-binding transcriptional regulator WhiA
VEDYYVENDAQDEYDEEKELGSEEAANQSYNNEPDLPSRKTVARVLGKVNADGTLKKIIRARKSDFVRNLIYLDGSKFDFTGRDYLRPIYDRNDPQILLKNARQTEKTTFLANNLTVSAVVQPFNKALYVSPSHTQTRQFSNEKLRPAIEKSPLIAKYYQDSKVSSQVFEKGFTNGSYIFLRSAFRSADRCIAKGTLITLEDGSVTSVEDLVGKTPNLISTDCINVVSSKSREVWSNGDKDVYRVTLESGHEVVVSSNHRWVTPDKIVNTENLKGEWVPIPLNFFKQYGSSPEYALIGYFLGDGCMSKNKNSASYKRTFNNNNYEIIEDFQKVCLSLGLTCTISTRLQKNVTNYTAKIQEREPFESILGRFGLLGKVWHDRFIPRSVFGSRSRSQDVLRAMFESDGWVSYSTKNRQCEVGWVSGSLQLARDVQYCLQGLGIYSVLNSKKPGKNNKNTSYNVKIRSVEQIYKFRDRVGFISAVKSTHLDALLFFAQDLDPNAVTKDLPARQDVNDALINSGISDHQLWEEYGISWRKNSTVNGCRVSQHKIKKIYDITRYEPLLKYLNPELVWVLVKDVVPYGRLETFDISVPGTETFVANGVFTHNTRGISARSLCLDEIQDFLGSEIPVIMECTSHFLDARTFMSGTPKSYDNPIEEYWGSTTQNEWIVKCTHCGKNNFLDETNIAPTAFYTSGKLPPGPICSGCQKPISPPLHGRWVSFRPGAPIQGYRVPQLMVPWICGLYDQWLKLLWKRDNYPFGQFYNEVLGLSYDSASKPITRDEIIACCSDYSLWNPAMLQNAVAANRYQLTAGIDWGEGNDGSEKSPLGKVRSASYTVLTIGGYMNQKVWKTLMVKRYMGKEIEPDYIVKDIARIVKGLGVKLVGVDWGHGWGVNNHLIRLLGPEMVVQYQHLPKLGQKMKWDHTGKRYHLHRNFMMSELFFDIKQKFVQFPKWSEFEPYAKDILGIFSEYSEYKREIKYDHKPSDPDDFFHSLLYAKLSSDLYLGKSRRYTADIPGGIGSIDLNNYTR